MEEKPDNTAVHITTKKIFIIILSLQLALLGLVGLDKLGLGIPILRQVIGFIYLTFIPGFLILRILKMDNNSTAETLLYSVGLSLSFLMLAGVLTNFLYPLIGISKPISETPLIITVSIFTLILCSIFYLRNKDYCWAISIDAQRVFSPPILFLSLLPFLAIIGVYVFNIYSNNTLLLFFLGIISSIPLLVVSNKFPKNSYVFAVWIISLSLLFHRSLAIGFEPSETIFPGIVKATGVWNPAIGPLHSSLLPNVILYPSLFSFLNISVSWGLKIFPPFIISFIPVILYQIYKDYIGEKGAFLSAFLYMSMFPFYRSLIGTPRTGMAIFFLSLLMLVMIDMKGRKGAFLSVIFSFFLVVSHYGTSYVFMYSLIASTMLRLTVKRWTQNNGKEIRLLSPNFTILFILLCLSWYMFTSSSAGFSLLVGFSKHVISSLSEFMSPASSYSAYALQKEWRSLTIEILKYLYLIISIFIGVGVLDEFHKYITKRNNETFDEEYLFFSLSFIGIILITLFPTAGFNTVRILMIILVLLSPFFILGTQTVIKAVKSIYKGGNLNRKQFYGVVALFLMFFMLLNSGFISETLSKDYAPSTFISKVRIMESDDVCAKAYLFKEEYKLPTDFLASAWILVHGDTKKTIYGDHFMTWRRLRYRKDYIPEYNLVLMGKEKPDIKLLEKNATVMDGNYIILGYHNLKEGILIEQYHPTIRYYNISALHGVLSSSNKIYTTKDSSIYQS